MSLFQDILSLTLLVAGSGFALVGGIGLLRLPDFYSRVHAVGVTDTMGAALVLLGCTVYSGINLVSFRLFLIWLFVYVIGPAATHALAKAAYAKGHKIEATREDRRGVVSH